MREVSDLVGPEGAAAAAALGPAGHAWLEEEAIDDQLTATLEQVGQARRPVRAVKVVVLIHGQPRHPPTFGCQRVARTGQLLLLDQQPLPRGLPFLRRDDLWGAHCHCALLFVVIEQPYAATGSATSAAFSRSR